MAQEILDDLAHDLETHQAQQATPILHRIKFDSTSVYLTKSYFHQLRTSKNGFGHYRIFSWADVRARAFLQFDVGTQSPALGSAQLIGRYRPDGDNLLDVQYQTRTGKFYFQDAQRELTGSSASVTSMVKIDPGAFMRLKEVIPTGAQGRAIYGAGSIIIDGPAGTGKTTTILQRVKILINQGTLPSDILLLAKSPQAAKSFVGLLKDIDVTGVVALPIGNFVSAIYKSDRTPSLQALQRIAEKAIYWHRYFLDATDERQISVNGLDPSFSKVTEIAPQLAKPYTAFVQSCRKLVQMKSDNSKLKASRRKAARAEVLQLRARLEATAKRDKRGNVLLGVQSKINDKVSAKEQALSVQMEHEFDALKARERLAHDRITGLRRTLENIFYSDATIGALAKGKTETKILPLFLQKLARRFRYTSVIIDEAQDVNEVDIELANLLGRDLVLSGDELQRETADGIGSWANLAMIHEAFTTPKQPAIFKLARNFRQTFELGACSYNYRELVLGRSIIQLDEEYFENEKGFFRPRVAYIESSATFLSTVRNCLKHIKDNYATRFPLVIFFENETSLSRMQTAVSKKGLTSSVDYAADHPQDIVFISLKNIAGREFPVVLSPLSSKYSGSLTYIILSRAQFHLTLMVRKGEQLDEKFKRLREAGLIEMEVV